MLKALLIIEKPLLKGPWSKTPITCKDGKLKNLLLGYRYKSGFNEIEIRHLYPDDIEDFSFKHTKYLYQLPAVIKEENWEVSPIILEENYFKTPIVSLPANTTETKKYLYNIKVSLQNNIKQETAESLEHALANLYNLTRGVKEAELIHYYVNKELSSAHLESSLTCFLKQDYTLVPSHLVIHIRTPKYIVDNSEENTNISTESRPFILNEEIRLDTRNEFSSTQTLVRRRTPIDNENE